MKKVIVIAALALISAATFAQPAKTPAKGKPVSPVKKDSVTYTFTNAEAAFLYQTLEDHKKLAALSPDISARQVNTVEIPKADSLERILGRQYNARQEADKAKHKADSLKSAPKKIKPKN